MSPHKRRNSDVRQSAERTLLILIGQYDSPFVRRVGIAMTLYGLPFTQQPWSIFGDADKIRAYNPLVRVPTLVLDDGDVLIDSTLGEGTRVRMLLPRAHEERPIGEFVGAF